MSRLKTLRLRINSIKNTKQMTKAMKMVSASKLKRSQTNIENALPYTESLQAMVHSLSLFSGSENTIFFDERPKGKAVVLVITTDKGLCGSLNSNIFKIIPEFVEKELKAKYDSHLFNIIGKKGNEYIRRNGHDVGDSFVDLREVVLKKEILGMIRKLVVDYKNEKCNAIYLIYNHCTSVIKQTPVVKKIFPISTNFLEDGEDNKKKDIQYIYEPNFKTVLEYLVPIYAETSVMTALLDSLASEHSARMMAMDSATKSADKILKKLVLKFNRARQAAITSELIEIISGAESL